jgi:hypothetical protein
VTWVFHCLRLPLSLKGGVSTLKASPAQRGVIIPFRG